MGVFTMLSMVSRTRIRMVCLLYFIAWVALDSYTDIFQQYSTVGALADLGFVVVTVGILWTGWVGYREWGAGNASE